MSHGSDALGSDAVGGPRVDGGKRRKPPDDELARISLRLQPLWWRLVAGVPTVAKWWRYWAFPSIMRRFVGAATALGEHWRRRLHERVIAQAMADAVAAAEGAATSAANDAEAAQHEADEAKARLESESISHVIISAKCVSPFERSGVTLHRQAVIEACVRERQPTSSAAVLRSKCRRSL